jgi:hypothetical protein
MLSWYCVLVQRPLMLNFRTLCSAIYSRQEHILHCLQGSLAVAAAASTTQAPSVVHSTHQSCIRHSTSWPRLAPNFWPHVQRRSACRSSSCT